MTETLNNDKKDYGNKPIQHPASIRDETAIEMKEQLSHIGQFAQMVEFYEMHADHLQASFLTAKCAARRLLLAGEIDEDQFFTVTMEFAKLVVPRINFAPQQSGLMVAGNMPPGPAIPGMPNYPLG